MSDHHDAEPMEPWRGGWFVALLAGLAAAVVARWLGGTEITTALLVGAFVFLVHGVILAMYWTPPPAASAGEGEHGHGHHH